MCITYGINLIKTAFQCMNSYQYCHHIWSMNVGTFSKSCSCDHVYSATCVYSNRLKVHQCYYLNCVYSATFAKRAQRPRFFDQKTYYFVFNDGIATKKWILTNINKPLVTFIQLSAVRSMFTQFRVGVKHADIYVMYYLSVIFDSFSQFTDQSIL